MLAPPEIVPGIVQTTEICQAEFFVTENPATAWIERCVGAWLQGPSPEWVQESQRQAQEVEQAQAQWQQQAQANPLLATVHPFAPPQFAPLPSPFPTLPNLSEIPVATVVVKRLSALMFDPRYADTKKYPPAWQALVVNVYNQARQAQIPPPTPPRVNINATADNAETLSAEEAAKPQAGPAPQQPQQQAPHGVAHQAMPAMPRIPA